MTGPDEDSSRVSSETGDESGRRPASGGQRPADSTASSAADSEPPAGGHEGDGGAPSGHVETEPAPESAVSSPPEAVPSADRESGSVDPEPDPVAELAKERDEFRDALIRLQADFENYKKRMMKQQSEHGERAAGLLVDKLLPVLDTADLALAHGGGEDVKQLTSALAGVLEREGLERIDPVGVRFDPTLHDAVAHEPGDGGEQEVAEVLRAGYRWKGRVLRPAMVKVRG
jgi:molecular chaperone GrpE